MKSPHYEGHGVQLFHGDCRDVMKGLPDNSVHSIVTDPPYDLTSGGGGGFMGHKWDGSGVAFQPAMWAEAMRVLKPGGHLLAAGGTRTWHRLACAIEDAGFQIRDSIAWLYGSGFPKSLDVSKAIDRDAGAERQIVGSKLGQPDYHLSPHDGGEAYGAGLSSSTYESRLISSQITQPASEAAQQWAGYGTALKPAFEPWVVARKPLGERTVAGNVLKHGTGALNIDGCRIAGEFKSGWSTSGSKASENASMSGANYAREPRPDSPAGRWPANVALSEDQAEELDRQSGERPGFASQRHLSPAKPGFIFSNIGAGSETHPVHEGYDGGASRFFYVPKADTNERVTLPDGLQHSTVKPLALMRTLVRLVTPPDGTVLEPFAGSGTTVEACVLEGFRCIAIELGAEYLPFTVQRINRRRDPVAYLTGQDEDLGLFL